MRSEVQRRSMVLRRKWGRSVRLGATLALMLAAGLAWAGETDEPDGVPYPEEQRWLDDEALAVRLAAFLWRTPPDTALRDLAARRELHRPEVLRAQTHRLLRDARARRFVDTFLASWLNVSAAIPTAVGTTPRCDEASLNALVETQSYFARVVRENAGLDSLVTSKCALLNHRLVERYGASAMEEMRRRPERLAHDVVHELAAYATGRRLHAADTSAVADILARSKADGYAVATLIHELVQSELFQSQ